MDTENRKYVPSKLTRTVISDNRTNNPSFLTTDGDIISYFINQKNDSQSGTVKNKHVLSAHIEISSKSLLPSLIWILLTALLGMIIYFSIDNPMVRLGSIAVTASAIFYFMYEHFSTDTGAVLRAIEMGSDVVIKATKVRGVYTADPVTEPDAEFIQEISFQEVVARELAVMDTPAVALCKQNSLPIIVLNLEEQGAVARAILGEPVGTLVS